MLRVIHGWMARPLLCPFVVLPRRNCSELAPPISASAPRFELSPTAYFMDKTMAKVSSGARVRGCFVGLLLLAVMGMLGGCGEKEAPAATAPPVSPASSDALKLLSARADAQQNRLSIVLQFNQPLASVQTFDQLLAVTGVDGEVVAGSWSLSNDGKTLMFPNVQPGWSYNVTVKAELQAASGKALGEVQKRKVNQGNLPKVLGFASSGSVLPARGSRGLPLVSTNVEDADIEFFRVRENALSSLFCSYRSNKQRSSYELSQPSNHWNVCDHGRAQLPLTEMGESVYANHYTLNGDADTRNLSYIPIQDVPQLQEPGVYMAVLRQGGSFSTKYDTTVFYVSDLGLHLRVYPKNALLHVASLESGKPVAQVSVTLDDEDGNTQFSGQTDKDGNLLITRAVGPTDVLVAHHDKDVSVLPFNRPALDVSNFDITGRRQAEIEVFAWSGRDLYRPGETPRVAALVRDYDGKALKAQPLFARLVQPDGRKLEDVRLEPSDLNEYEWSKSIPADAPTGTWQLEFRLYPGDETAQQVFSFHVEEFLPERLKLELSSEQERVQPNEALQLNVQANYLYGSPAEGNRFTAKLLAKPEVHPLANLADTFFGNPFVKVSASADDVLDTQLAADGSLKEQVLLPSGVEPVAPFNLVLSGSVYETGGRAVTRVFSRLYWPANELVGVRPLFDPVQGARPQAQASFEILRANSAGELVAAEHLQVRLMEEDRYYYWYRDPGQSWQTDNDAQLNLVDQQEVDVAAGQRATVSFPVGWGNYRVEVYDPQTKLTTSFPFFAGYSWQDENAGKEARPDKVKVALDKTGYRAGDTLKITVTPPQDGPGILLVESDHLLYSQLIEAKAGATFEVPVTAEWERQDVHVVALVFRGGSAKDRTTPARAMGIEHVNMERNDRRIALKLDAPTLIRPMGPLQVTVQADDLAGQKAYVRLTAVDQGVLNITNYPVPDAWTWLFSKRAMSVEAYDLYSRVIEAMDGVTAALRYGGDMSGDALPKASRLKPRVLITDLLAAPVQFDPQGKAVVNLDVPDFNGSLRVTALAYGEQRFGNASANVTVQAPLLVEPSTPRVMSAGDQARISVDVKNFSGQSGVAKVTVRGSGLIDVANSEQSVSLENGKGTTLYMPVSAQAGVDVAKVDIQAELNEYKVDRHFEFSVRNGWPQTLRSVPMAIAGKQEVRLDAGQTDGLVPSTVNSQLSLSTLPPLPYRSALKYLHYYPYSCIEQTTSGGYGALFMDEKTSKALGLGEISTSMREAKVNSALSRIASYQASNGHFTFWGGSSPITPFMTPYVVDFMLDARDAGFAVPEQVLQKALERLNDDLLSGGDPYYGYEHHDHMRVANLAYAGFVLARVNRASLGTLRALFDNQTDKLVAPLPLVHLGIALKLMGDNERAQKAIEKAFAWSKERPWYVGDYGSELRDLGVMVALTHSYKMNTAAYDAKLVEWARNASAKAHGAQQNSYYYGWTWAYLSTQEQIAIARVAHAFDAANNAPLAVSVQVGEHSETVPANTFSWTRSLSKAELTSGVVVKPQTDATVFATFDTAGIGEQPPAVDDAQIKVRRDYFLTDGKRWGGGTLREGDSLIVQLTIEARMNVPDAMATDLLPGGLEVENLNLSGAQAWEGVVVDGIRMEEHEQKADVVHEEYRDDRYAAALKLRRGEKARLYYLVRAVTPGTYSVPPPIVEDMYRPAVRGIGETDLKTLTVGGP